MIVIVGCVQSISSIGIQGYGKPMLCFIYDKENIKLDKLFFENVNLRVKATNTGHQTTECNSQHPFGITNHR